MAAADALLTARGSAPAGTDGGAAAAEAPQKSIDELLAEIEGPDVSGKPAKTDVSGSGGGKKGKGKGKQKKKKNESNSKPSSGKDAAATNTASSAAIAEATPMRMPAANADTPLLITNVVTSTTPAASAATSDHTRASSSRGQLLREIARTQSQLSEVNTSIARLQQPLDAADKQHVSTVQAARLAAFKRGPAVIAELNGCANQRSELEVRLASVEQRRRRLETQLSRVSSAPSPVTSAMKGVSAPSVDVLAARSVLRHRLAEAKTAAAQIASAASAAAVAAGTACDADAAAPRAQLTPFRDGRASSGASPAQQASGAM